MIVSMGGKPLTREDLKAAFDEIERQPLKAGRILMDERTYADLFGKPCKSCGGHYTGSTPHTPADCDFERARQVIEQ